MPILNLQNTKHDVVTITKLNFQYFTEQTNERFKNVIILTW